MLEEELELYVREGDEDLVQDIIPECEEKYAQILMEQTGREYACKLSVY